MTEGELRLGTFSEETTPEGAIIRRFEGRGFITYDNEGFKLANVTAEDYQQAFNNFRKGLGSRPYDRDLTMDDLLPLDKEGKEVGYKITVEIIDIESAPRYRPSIEEIREAYDVVVTTDQPTVNPDSLD